MVNWRDRVVEMRRVPASELNANPKNWREHPLEQQRAMKGVLEEVGIAGALLARETPDGLELIDGHLRTEMDDATEWPVLILDVNENEADILLASVDPIGALAKTNETMLSNLLSGVDTENEDLTELLRDISEDVDQFLSDNPVVPDVKDNKDDDVYGAATSLVRGSAPLKYWRDEGLLKGKVLDFGCGQDEHAFAKFDPFTSPDTVCLLGNYEVVMCNYVLNVQPSDHIIDLICMAIRSVLAPGGIALFALVTDSNLSGSAACGNRDAKPPKEWKAILEKWFKVSRPQSASFCAFKCEAI